MSFVIIYSTRCDEERMVWMFFLGWNFVSLKTIKSTFKTLNKCYPKKLRFLPHCLPCFSHILQKFHSNGCNSATVYPIPFLFGSRVGFSGTADQLVLFRVCWNPRLRFAAILKKNSNHHVSGSLSVMTTAIPDSIQKLYCTEYNRLC